VHLRLCAMPLCPRSACRARAPPAVPAAQHAMPAECTLCLCAANLCRPTCYAMPLCRLFLHVGPLRGLPVSAKVLVSSHVLLSGWLPARPLACLPASRDSCLQSGRHHIIYWHRHARPPLFPHGCTLRPAQVASGTQRVSCDLLTPSLLLTSAMQINSQHGFPNLRRKELPRCEWMAWLGLVRSCQTGLAISPAQLVGI